MPPCPAQNGKVGNRELVGDELAIGEPAIEHTIKPARLLGEPLESITPVLLVRERDKVMHLARHRPKAAHLPHQPFQHRNPLAKILGQKLASLLAQVEQNGAGFEHARRPAMRAIGIDDRRNLVVRADLEEIRRELLVLGDIDWIDLIGQSHLFQSDADLAAVGRIPGVKFDRHSNFLANSNAGALLTVRDPLWNVHAAGAKFRQIPAPKRSLVSISASRARLAEIIRTRSFGRGEITLASGRKSDFYFNLKPTMLDPEGAALLAELSVDALKDDNIDYIGGLEMGAVPLAGAIAQLSWMKGTPIAAFFVRKKPKEHGARLAVEGLAKGETLQGKRIVIVEDVTTTGGSAIKAVDAVRDAGGEVVLVFTMVDRNEGAAEVFAEAKIPFRSLYKAGEFLGS